MNTKDGMGIPRGSGPGDRSKLVIHHWIFDISPESHPVWLPGFKLGVGPPCAC